MNSKYVVQLYDSIVLEREFILVLEYCNQGDLVD